MGIKKQRRMRAQHQLQPTQIIALAFILIIAVGTALLCLPVASRSGNSAGLLTALFTATSSTCVTGLILVDTWSQWSGFGQVVILCLIEIGGLGFMSAACLVIFALRRKVGLRQRMIMVQALSLNDAAGVVRLQKMVIAGSLGVQAAGALILTLWFWPQYGFTKAIRWGVFHAVSAFCNAGFDILGVMEPGASLMLFQNDPMVLITISALIVVGGLGFFVWEEVFRVRKFSKFSVYTKLVLIMSGALTAAGMLCFCLLEWNNPGTLGNMSVGGKLLGGFFQSVTTRTAGFTALDQGQLTPASKGITILLMLIGGSSGSTAGGIKTVTILVLVLFMINRARGKKTVAVFLRTIPQEKVLDAVTITSIIAALAVFGGIFISATSGVDLVNAFYEAASALATVGLTAGSTGELSVVSQILLILYMYFGRVGVLTLSLGFLSGDGAEERFRYAQTNLLIG